VSVRPVRYSRLLDKAITDTIELEFDDGTLLLRGATESVPYGEWDDRVDEYRAQAYRYRELLEWSGTWNTTRDQRDTGPAQRTPEQGFDQTIEDTARAYLDLELTPALHIEPRDYQQPPSTPGSTTVGGGASSSPLGAGRRSSGCRPSPTPA